MVPKRNGRRVVTPSVFAQMHNVARHTVEKAIKRGEIVEEVGGGIDVEKGAAVWLARRERYRASADVHAKREAAELMHTAARLRIEQIKYEKALTARVDRAAAQATIDTVVTQLLAALDAPSKGPPWLREASRRIKADIADLLPLAARVTDPDFELPSKPAEKD
jgi:hypothetical protein